jgi:hypothetical protein
MTDNLGDFFSLIGEAKKEKDNTKKKLMGDLSLTDLFMSLEEEKKRTKKRKEEEKKEKERLQKQAKAFESFLYSEKKPVNTTDWRDDYKPLEIETTNIIEPEPLIKEEEKEEEKVELTENIERSMEILEKLIPEEEKIDDSETEIVRLKREMDQLRKMVYESVRTATAQGGGGEVRLEFLDDVDRDSAKVNGMFLKYDDTSGKWVGSAAAGAGATVFTDLNDVDGSVVGLNRAVVWDTESSQFIGSDILGSLREVISEDVDDGAVLTYSASEGRFIATTPANVGIRTQLADLDDVSVAGIQTNGVLIFNGIDFEFTTPFEVVDRSDGTDDNTLDYGSF